MTAGVADRHGLGTQPGSTRAEVLAVERAGTYWKVSVREPHLASESAPGQFLAVAVGDGLGMILRRYFSVLDADVDTGVVQFVVAVYSAGTGWLADRSPGDELDVLGPLGRPFPQSAEAGTCVIVGGGHGCMALYRLARERVERGDEVHLMLGATTESRLYLPPQFGAGAASVRISTDDGSLGQRGSVCDLAVEAVGDCAPDVVYACGPMPMLAAVSQRLAHLDAPVYTATEARMACGVGLCMTCVLPIVGADGVTRMTRSCYDGPVFDSGQVRWGEIGSIPADCWGA